MSSAALAALLLLAVAPAWVGRSGTLEVHQVAVTDSARFLREWDRPGDNAQLTVDSRVAYGRPLSTFVVFKGCKPDAKRLCHLGGALTLVDPAGKRGASVAFRVWDGAPLPGNVFQRSPASPEVKFDATDPPGRHRFELTTTDEVAGTKVRTVVDVEIAAR